MIDPDLVTAAKAQLTKMKLDAITRNLPLADRELLKKYPKHTLAAARLIDSTPLCRATLLSDQVGHTPGEDFNSLQWQANGELPSRQ
jgi:hypothetical protein